MSLIDFTLKNEWIDLWLFIFRGEITLGDSLGFLGLYVVYIIVVVVGRVVNQKFLRRDVETGKAMKSSPLLGPFCSSECHIYQKESFELQKLKRHV